MNKNQNQDSYQREIIPDKFIFFFKIGKAKNVNRVSKIGVCMYVSEMCAEGIFVTFPWWLKHVKSRSKIALFSNEHHFEMWFLKKKTTTFFWSKLSKLHKKDPILHVTTTFSLKQGETRTISVPIPHPLNRKFNYMRRYCKIIQNWVEYRSEKHSKTCMEVIFIGFFNLFTYLFIYFWFFLQFFNLFILLTLIICWLSNILRNCFENME